MTGSSEPEPEREPQFKPPNMHGQPGDHRYTFPDDRIPSDVTLKTAAEYEAAGATLYTAHPAAYRTHEDDPDPIVATFDGILDEAEIAHIIETATPKLRRAGVTTEQGTGGRQSSGRTNSLAWLPHDTTPKVLSVVNKIAAVVGIPAENAESLQVIKYELGQKYNKHCDAYDPSNQRGRNACKDGGNRVVTALIYLTDVEKGGGTGFTNLRLEVRPKPGRLLIFHNCYEGTGSLHPDSMHAGLPVEAGEKWACNLWFRERETASGGAAKRRMLAQNLAAGQEAGEWSSGVEGAAQSVGVEASAVEAASTTVESSKALELRGARQQAEQGVGSKAAAAGDETATAALARAPAPATADASSATAAQASPADDAVTHQ